ncbi:non-ribosomal peptide synthetase [Pseudomonas monteilii]|uniref:Non-ribosomal peptide synthetase n=1 Tax=Pseudomonas monteilii TaxID=76759 RepID=A0AAE6V341_9PSED|nr:non-ribosomal peptide synthetase [Pseudomonas monteilii]
MPKHTQNQFPGCLHRDAVGGDGFGERLINGLVETNHVVDIMGLYGHLKRQPQAQHACAQCTIFSNNLVKGETSIKSGDGVYLRCSFDRAGRLHSTGFLELLNAVWGDAMSSATVRRMVSA